MIMNFYNKVKSFLEKKKEINIKFIILIKYSLLSILSIQYIRLFKFVIFNIFIRNINIISLGLRFIYLYILCLVTACYYIFIINI